MVLGFIVYLVMCFSLLGPFYTSSHLIGQGCKQVRVMREDLVGPSKHVGASLQPLGTLDQQCRQPTVLLFGLFVLWVLLHMELVSKLAAVNFPITLSILFTLHSFHGDWFFAFAFMACLMQHVACEGLRYTSYKFHNRRTVKTTLLCWRPAYLLGLLIGRWLVVLRYLPTPIF